MNSPWVDSVMKTLDIDHQIAQCIWIAGYSNRDISHEVELTNLIKKYGVGGIVFFQGTAAKQAELTNYYQRSQGFLSLFRSMQNGEPECGLTMWKGSLIR